MSTPLKINISPDGIITRNEDDKHLADVNLDTGKVKYANAAYAKGNYKATIDKAAEEFMTNEPPGEVEPTPAETKEPEPQAPTKRPPLDPSLGSFSPAHINYDHATMSDKEFAEKYKRSAHCQLELMDAKPELFSDIEGLEKRFGKLSKG